MIAPISNVDKRAIRVYRVNSSSTHINEHFITLLLNLAILPEQFILHTNSKKQPSLFDGQTNSHT